MSQSAEKKLVLGTRGSKLALWQAHHIEDQLKKKGVEVDIKVIKTRGDKIQDIGFSKMEGKGFFTKEIEDALLEQEIDFAVHSMKDLPTQNPEGLCLAALSYREDPSDCLIIRKEKINTDSPFKLYPDAVVGTSSARRKAQMLHYLPQLQIKDIRGNVPTRLKKLKEGSFDAILLASAGLNRLEIDLGDFIFLRFHPTEFVPAPAQGVIALQCRESDIQTRKILQKIHHKEVAERTNIERKVLSLFDGGCQMPLGCYCEVDDQGNYHLWAAKAEAWNAPINRVHLSRSTKLGLAEEMVEALNKAME